MTSRDCREAMTGKGDGQNYIPCRNTKETEEKINMKKSHRHHFFD